MNAQLKHCAYNHCADIACANATTWTAVSVCAASIDPLMRAAHARLQCQGYDHDQGPQPGHMRLSICWVSILPCCKWFKMQDKRELASVSATEPQQSRRTKPTRPNKVRAPKNTTRPARPAKRQPATRPRPTRPQKPTKPVTSPQNLRVLVSEIFIPETNQYHPFHAGFALSLFPPMGPVLKWCPASICFYHVRVFQRQIWVPSGLGATRAGSHIHACGPLSHKC